MPSGEVRAVAAPAAASPYVRFLPSGRSLVIGLVIATLGVLAYVGARETSVFAVRTLDVRGGTAQTRAHVRRALAGELGTNLMGIGRATLARRLADLPEVLAFTYDRSFPSTLRVTVRRERPVLVLRQGKTAFLVAATGRVLQVLPHPRRSHLPRLWVPTSVLVAVGETLPPTPAGAARALAVANNRRLPGGVRSIELVGGSCTLALGTGFELRLGQPSDVLLKLTIAKRILQAAARSAGVGYLDVSVPERPVLSFNPKVTS